MNADLMHRSHKAETDAELDALLPAVLDRAFKGGVVINPSRIISGRYNVLIRDTNGRKKNDFAT